LANLPIGKGVDGVAYDAQVGLIYASNKDGTLNVIRQTSADKYESLGSVKTVPGAKTMVLDPTRHRIFLPAARGSQQGISGGEFSVYVVE
jgi:hypothetical protein